MRDRVYWVQHIRQLELSVDELKAIRDAVQSEIVEKQASVGRDLHRRARELFARAQTENVGHPRMRAIFALRMETGLSLAECQDIIDQAGCTLRPATCDLRNTRSDT